MFAILAIKFPFSCGESDLYWNIVKFQNIMAKIVGNFSDDSSIGFFLELDLNYIDQLHDLHNDYPLTLVKIKVINEVNPWIWRRNQRSE